MPPPTSNPEAVARSVLEKAPGPGAAVRSAEQKRGDAIREKAKKDGARSALESLRQKPKIDKADTDRIIDENIGVKRKANGEKNRTAQEKARFDSAKKWKGFNEALLDGGYDSLTDPGNKNLARGQVEKALRAWPAGDALLTSMNATDRQAAIERILRDPKFTEKLRSVYDGTFSGENVLADTVTEAANRALEAETKKTKVDGEIAKNKLDLSQVNTALDRYKVDPTTGAPIGADITRIKNIEARMPTLTAEQNTKAVELQLLQEEYNAMKLGVRTGAVTPAELAAKGTEVVAKQREILTIEAEIHEKEGLETKKNNLDSQKQTIETKLQELDVERASAVSELSAARADRASQELSRASQEGQFTENMKGMVSEAAMQVMEDEVTAAEAAEREIIETEIKNTQDPAEKAILQGLLERWEKDKEVGIWSKSRIKVYDKERINADFSEVMETGSTRNTMWRMMRDAGMSDDEIRAKISDPEFVDKMQPQVAERLLTYKIQTGKLNEDEVRRIFNSEWGEGMIEKAIQRRDSLRKTINDLESKGILQGGVKEWLRKASGGEKWKFLLILLAAIAGSVVAANALPLAIGGGAAAAEKMIL